MLVLDDAGGSTPPAAFICEDYASAPASQIEVLDSGAIRAVARLARTGVQEYAPWDGCPVQGRMVRLYRPADEVFHPDSIKTLRASPIVVGHPPEGSVTRDSWKRLAIGFVEAGDAVQRVKVEDSALDGKGQEFIQTPVVIADGAAIARAMSKGDDRLCEFSSGYTMTIDWTAGFTADGVAYDGVQRNIRHNHQAFLPPNTARAGNQARILIDRKDPEAMNLTKEQYDALVARAVAGDAAVAELATIKAELADAKAKLVASDAKVGELTTKLALVPAPSAANDDVRINAVIELRDAARPMLPAEYSFEGKTSRQIKLDALKAVAPDAAAALGAEPNDAAIDGAFGVLKAQKTVYVKKTDGKPATANDHLTAYNERMRGQFTFKG